LYRTNPVIPALSRDLPSSSVNQVVFPRSRPAVDPLLAQNGRVHFFVNLKPDEPLDLISARETAHRPFAMLPDTRREV
jgi:hypothetical protein